ncbi:MAG: DUF1801 domain-containing protein [Isosphaeraceae bacterium]
MEKPKPRRSPRANDSSQAEKGRDPGDWRAETLDRIRVLILEADPEIVEEVKWRKPSNGMVGVPVWSRHGIICTGETYAKAVKLTFAKGAALPDPSGLFNASLEGNTRRAIDIREGETINARAFRTLIQAAVAINAPAEKKAAPGPMKAAKSSTPKAGEAVLLSGGNPQIAKGDGDAPVQAYIAAMPTWKRGVGERLDAIITREVPGVRKAIKWNSPFYGIEGLGWFVSFHTFARYLKVAFFRGSSLQPIPPVASKNDETRYFHVHEGEPFDEEQFAAWVKQAAALPGWNS